MGGGNTGTSFSNKKLSVHIPIIANHVAGCAKGEESHPAIMAFVPVRLRRPQVIPPLLCSKRMYVHVVLLVVIVLLLVLIRLMTQVRVTFVHYHQESDMDAELVTLPLSYAKSRKAYCLDGSPPAYYYRPSPLTDVSYWIIYIPGGSWCETDDSCMERSLGHQGSSRSAEMFKNLNGILSGDCRVNPDFCLWNIVILHYCDGGSFLGNNTEKVFHKSRELYYRGALVFDALIEYLAAATPLGKAEQVILAGTSAGGISALIHADRLRSKLPQSVKSLHALVDGSIFLDVPDIHGKHTMAQIFQSFYDLHGVKYSESIIECTATKAEADGWQCLLPEVYNNFVFTPVFYINSVYDNWQRSNSLQILCSTIHCPESHREIVNVVRDSIHDFAKKAVLSRKNGLFLTVCPAHGLLTKHWFSRSELGTPNLQALISAWLQHNEIQSDFDVSVDLDTAVHSCPSYI